ncbi:MAG: OsmC family protein [Chloroflexi bacterium]|nr:OsmC family protein [Chloroflexota bacterium]
MAVRSAEAIWQGTLADGGGTVKMGSGLLEAPYTFQGRVEEGEPGTNPEELLGAAHAACFTMFLSAQLSRAGFNPTRLHTTAKVTLRRDESGLKITAIELHTEGQVPGVDEAKFLELAEVSKKNCPVSAALASVETTLHATLLK